MARFFSTDFNIQGRGGRQETPSILDMGLPNCRDAANIA
jgi:hypothetical protein